MQALLAKSDEVIAQEALDNKKLHLEFFVASSALRSFTRSRASDIFGRMFFVYIIRSMTDGSHYTGTTTDVQQRLIEHNRKQSKYTSGHGPFELVWFCAFKNNSKALAFEKYLKSGSGFAFAGKRLH